MKGAEKQGCDQSSDVDIGCKLGLACHYQRNQRLLGAVACVGLVVLHLWMKKGQNTGF